MVIYRETMGRKIVSPAALTVTVLVVTPQAVDFYLTISQRAVFDAANGQ